MQPMQARPCAFKLMQICNRKFAQVWRPTLIPCDEM